MNYYVELITFTVEWAEGIKDLVYLKVFLCSVLKFFISSVSHDCFSYRSMVNFTRINLDVFECDVNKSQVW